MEVENVGKKPKSAKKLTTKNKWIILFSVFGVVIVGLVIAIVVVLVNRNNPQEVAENDESYNEAFSLYADDNEEIANLIVEQDLSDEEMLKLLKEKVDAAENEKTKAMLEVDYYLTMFAVQGRDEGKKEEIMNGLIGAYDVLHTFDAAQAVANSAFAYDDLDLYNEYVKIMKEINPSYKSFFDALEEMSE